jgi:hypothetical protein
MNCVSVAEPINIIKSYRQSVSPNYIHLDLKYNYYIIFTICFDLKKSLSSELVT